jgi:hypothetical protein
MEVLMDRKRLYRTLFILVLVVFAVGCNFVTNIVSTVRTVATGEAIVSQVGGIVTQVGGIVTQVDVGAITTQMGAMVTQIDPEKMATQMAPMVTQMGSMITEMAPMTTQIAPLTTQLGISSGNAPDDIPIMDGEKNGFVASPQAVSYFINTDLQKALAFYQTEMPKKGWTLVESGTRIGDNDAELHFEKDGRKAIVILALIPFVNQTTVVITLE